jgi:hypothetical protein
MKHLLTSALIAFAFVCMAAPMRNSNHTKQNRVPAAQKSTPALPPFSGGKGQQAQSGSDRKPKNQKPLPKDWTNNYLMINNNGGGQTWYH